MASSDTELKNATLEEIQFIFNELHSAVLVAEPQVAAMQKTAAEAAMVLADMRHRRGRAAYWLTIKKGQR